MMHKQFKQRFAAAAVAGVLVFGSGLAIDVTPAAARTVTGLDATAAFDPSTIDAARPVNVRFTLKAGNPNDTVQPIKLAGRTLQAERIDGVDLTTRAGWKRAQELTVKQARKADRTAMAKATTAEEGVVNFANLPVGLYLITEVVPTSATEETFVLVPFLITLPTGAFSGTEWDYDVEIEAKSEPNPDANSGSSPLPTPPETPGIPTFPWVPEVPEEPTPTPTPSVTTTPSVTPGVLVPPAPPGPGQPDVPPESDKPDSSSLARTGASVLGLVLIGAGLVLGGVMLRRRKS